MTGPGLGENTGYPHGKDGWEYNLMSRLKWGCGGATKGFDRECGGGKMGSMIWEDLCLGPQVDTGWQGRHAGRPV